MRYSLGDIIEIIGGSCDPAQPDCTITGYSIDSRTVQDGDIFFAIQGENHDAHAFVDNAIAAGASAAIVKYGFARKDGATTGLIFCDDPLKALHDLAAFSRQEPGLTVIGITGSCGKTTTKDLIAATLSTRLAVGKNRGNLNNVWGLPLELLRRDKGLDAYVSEMGMSYTGELRMITRIARPDIAVYTNINPVHLANFSSMREIAEAKAEMIEGLMPGGTIVANGDDPEVMRIVSGKGHAVITYGFGEACDLRAIVLEDRGIQGSVFEIDYRGKRFKAETNLSGRHNLYNVSAAVAAGLARGLEIPVLLSAINDVDMSPMRSHIQKLSSGWTLYNDSYNSNPAALKHVLNTLSTSDGYTRKIAVLGDMLELGDNEAAMHFDCGRHVARAGIDLLVSVGTLAMQFAEGARAAGMRPEQMIHFSDSAGARDAVKDLVKPGDLVLVKGSRGVRMERIVEVLLAGEGPADVAH